MSVNKAQKFNTIQDAVLFLNGAVIGKKLGNTGISGLVGKKIKFSLPTAIEYTFVTGAGVAGDIYTLTLLEIKSQLEAAVTGLLVRTVDGKLVFMESTPLNGVSIIAATSNDARAALGLDAGAPIATKVYKPAIVSTVAPCWISIEVNDDSTHTIYTWE